MYNSKLEEFKKYIKGRKVAFIGIGVSNIPAIKYINRLGAKVTAFDKRKPNDLGDICIELESLGVGLSLGDDYLESLVGFEVIFRSPSVRPDLPEIEKELDKGAVLTSEIEMVMEMCPGKIIGITGSGGKTTTTTLIGEMLNKQELEYYVGGNIGIPLFDKIEDMNENTIVVLELSSFQLMTMTKSPHIAVITSLSPDHLDVHKDLEEYYDSKKNIFKFQEKDDILILNYDNDLVRKLKTQANGIVKFFSGKERLSEGIILDDNKIKIAENKIRKHILNTDDIKIIGRYNLLNLCAAIQAVEGIVSIENIQKVANEFSGVEHRMQIVKEENGIRYINNSIASSPIKAITSLQDFNEKLILLVGGYDRNLDLDEFAKTIIEKGKILILFGQTKTKVKEALNRVIEEMTVPIDIKIIDSLNFEDAVIKAKINAKSGDTVLLSPGFASFDEFKDYKERGNKFLEIINKE